LRVERGGQSGADDYGERVESRRSFVGENEMKSTMMIKVDGATHARGDGAKATLLTLLVLLLTLGTVAAESASPSNALAQSPGRSFRRLIRSASRSATWTLQSSSSRKFYRSKKSPRRK